LDLPKPIKIPPYTLQTDTLPFWCDDYGIPRG
jgi:hypothetical protein